MSTSSENDQNLAIVVPNGSYTLTLYGEPGYGITASGHSVYDAEINGTVAASYQDSWLLSGAQLYHGYTVPYTATVSTGLLQFNGRIRESDPSGYGFSLSSLLITPSGSPPALSISTTSLPGGTVGNSYVTILTATGGVLPYSWSITAGSLCAGLNLVSGGTISGVPTTPGTCSFTVQVQDSTTPTLQTATQPLTIVIAGFLGNFRTQGNTQMTGNVQVK
jgi:hypothetical protein